jgi:hypothetical protein
MLLIFEVFTAVTMKNAVIWDVTPCGSCKNRHFGGKYRLHHGDKNSISVFLPSVLRLQVTANVVHGTPILVTPMMQTIRSPKRRFLLGPLGVTSQRDGILQLMNSSRIYIYDICCKGKVFYETQWVENCNVLGVMSDKSTLAARWIHVNCVQKWIIELSNYQLMHLQWGPLEGQWASRVFSRSHTAAGSIRPSHFLLLCRPPRSSPSDWLQTRVPIFMCSCSRGIKSTVTARTSLFPSA